MLYEVMIINTKKWTGRVHGRDGKGCPRVEGGRERGGACTSGWAKYNGLGNLSHVCVCERLDACLLSFLYTNGYVMELWEPGFYLYRWMYTYGMLFFVIFKTLGS